MLSSVKLEELDDFGKAYLLPPSSDLEVSFAGGFVVKVAVSDVIEGAIKHPGKAEWFAGFGSTCPHMGCLVSKVSYAELAKSLVTLPCPCHGSTFDLAKGGLVVLGPATQNLPQLKLEISGDDLKAVSWLRETDPDNENWPCNPAPSSPTGVV